MTAIYLGRDDRAQPHQAPNTAAWFGKITTIEQQMKARQALDTLLVWSRKHFGSHITMQTHPIGFGRQLLLNSLPSGMHYPQIPEAISRKLHGYSALPHRVEKFDHEATGKDYEYDARVAFLAVARRMPTYLPQAWLHDTGTDYVAGQEAWYLCDVQVPKDWDNIGLVPGGKIDTGKQPTYIYPRVPGDRFRYWLHCSEVRLLRDYAWPHQISERAVFAPPAVKGSDPTRFWQEKLIAALEGCETDPLRWSALRVALRRVALDTIGGFLTNGLANAGVIRTDEGWVNAERVSNVYGTQMRYHMPHWNCAITARARVMATRTALLVPRGQLISITADAVHTTVPLVGLATDTGKVGAYRLKGVANG